MTQKHVAKSGRTAGQWVTCTAKQACRNGGNHVSENAVKLVSERTYTPIKDLTEADVINYINNYNVEKVKTVNNEHLIRKNDVLSPAERQAMLTEQLGQADKLLGAGTYNTYLAENSQNLMCRKFEKGKVTTITFYDDSWDGKEYFSEKITLTEDKDGYYNEDIAPYNQQGQPDGRHTFETKDSYTLINYSNGVINDVDAGTPAYVKTTKKDKEIRYYKDGKLHREGDQPAVRINDKLNHTITHEYYIDGKLSRKDLSLPVISSGNPAGASIQQFADKDGKIIKLITTDEDGNVVEKINPLIGDSKNKQTA